MNGKDKDIFLGRLGREPELRYTKDQKPVCQLSVAVNKGNQDRAIWHKVVVWGKQAELAKQYLRKGSAVFVQGRKEVKSFRTKEGSMKSYEEVNANLVGFSNL